MPEFVILTQCRDSDISKWHVKIAKSVAWNQKRDIARLQRTFYQLARSVDRRVQCHSTRRGFLDRRTDDRRGSKTHRLYRVYRLQLQIASANLALALSNWGFKNDDHFL